MNYLSIGLIIAAVILAIIEQINARGKSLTGWAVILICLALLKGIF